MNKKVLKGLVVLTASLTVLLLVVCMWLFNARNNAEMQLEDAQTRAKAEQRRACNNPPAKGYPECEAPEKWKPITMLAGDFEERYIVWERHIFPHAPLFQDGYSLAKVQYSLKTFSINKDGVVTHTTQITDSNACIRKGFNIRRAYEGGHTFSANEDGFFYGEHKLFSVSEASLHPQLDAVEGLVQTQTTSLLGTAVNQQKLKNLHALAETLNAVQAPALWTFLVQDGKLLFIPLGGEANYKPCDGNQIADTVISTPLAQD